MKKNIGNVLALYPTLAVVVGTEVNEKVNWLLVAHVGIIGHDRILLSMHKAHYTNQGVKATGKELMSGDGFTLKLDQPRKSELIYYKKL